MNDTDRLNFLEQRASRIACAYRRGWQVTLGFPWPVVGGKTLRDAIDEGARVEAGQASGEGAEAAAETPAAAMTAADVLARTEAIRGREGRFVLRFRNPGQLAWRESRTVYHVDDLGPAILDARHMLAVQGVGRVAEARVLDLVTGRIVFDGSHSLVPSSDPTFVPPADSPDSSERGRTRLGRAMEAGMRAAGERLAEVVRASVPLAAPSEPPRSEPTGPADRYVVKVRLTGMPATCQPFGLMPWRDAVALARSIAERTTCPEVFVAEAGNPEVQFDARAERPVGL